MAKKKAKTNPRKIPKKQPSLFDLIKDSPVAEQANAYLREIRETDEAPGMSYQRQPADLRYASVLFAQSLEKSLNDSVGKAFAGIIREVSHGRALPTWMDRARWVGYLFGVYLRNTPSTETEKIETFMAYYGEFDYERELIDDNWILPITGVFYNDIRANWLAKKVKDMDTSHMLYLAEGICSRIVCQVRNAYLNGFVTSYAVMPRLPESANDVLPYLHEFCVEHERRATPMMKNSREENIYLSYTGVIKSALLKNKYSFLMPDMLPDILSVDAVGTCAPGIKKVDTRMLKPEKAINGVDINELVEGEIDDALHTSTQDISEFIGVYNGMLDCLLDPDDPTMAQAAIAFRAVLDRERLFYAEELARLKAKGLSKQKWKEEETSNQKYEAAVKELETAKKQLAARDDKIFLLQQRVDTLQKRLDDAQKHSSSSKMGADEATKKVAELEREVEALQAIVESQLNAEAERAQTLDFSIFDDFRVAIIGGHMTWANNMRNIHKNVRVFDCESLREIDDDVLLNADAIWIQSNCIAHKTFYRVSDRAATYKKELHYFHSAGWNTCRKELVDETKYMVKQKEREKRLAKA